MEGSASIPLPIPESIIRNSITHFITARGRQFLRTVVEPRAIDIAPNAAYVSEIAHSLYRQMRSNLRGLPRDTGQQYVIPMELLNHLGIVLMGVTASSRPAHTLHRITEMLRRLMEREVSVDLIPNGEVIITIGEEHNGMDHG